MTNTVESLIADLADPDRLLRNNAVWALIDFGEAARPAIPALKLSLIHILTLPTIYPV